jgi:hypothetical protein
MSANGPQPALKSGCRNPAILDYSRCTEFSSVIAKNVGLVIPVYVRYDANSDRPIYSCTVQSPTIQQNCASLSLLGFSWGALSPTAADQTAEIDQECSMSRCFSTNITNATICNRFPITGSLSGRVEWVVGSYRGGQSGICVATFFSGSQSQQIQACNQLGSNWRFYAGRQFTAGQLETQDKCTAGFCSSNLKLNAQDCSLTPSCSISCSGCVAQSGVSACLHLNQTLCSLTGATWMNDIASLTAAAVNVTTNGNGVCAVSSNLGAAYSSCISAGGALMVCYCSSDFYYNNDYL